MAEYKSFTVLATFRPELGGSVVVDMNRTSYWFASLDDAKRAVSFQHNHRYAAGEPGGGEK